GGVRWLEVIQPAIELARGGVELTGPQAHLHAILDLIMRHLPEGRRIYSRPDDGRLQPGDIVVLPDLADTLELIAAEGPAVVYRGELAGRVVETVAAGGGPPPARRPPADPGRLRGPGRVGSRGHEVTSTPPPSSGGVLITYGLALLERVSRGPAGSAEAIASLAEVMREQTRARSGDLVAENLLAADAIAGAVERI